MRASSAASLQAAIIKIDTALGKIADFETGNRAANECFAVEKMVSESMRMARCFTDPARKPQDKQALVEQLFSKDLSVTILEGLKVLVSGRFSDQADLAESLVIIGNHILLKTAADLGVIEEVQAEVFAVSKLISRNRQLRIALSDEKVLEAEKRIELISLVSSQISKVSMALVADAVRRTKPGHLVSDLNAICAASAAMQSCSMATVTSAVELSTEQMLRISKALEAKCNRKVILNLIVDENVIGGIKISFENTVHDASLSKIINKTKRQLVG